MNLLPFMVKDSAAKSGIFTMADISGVMMSLTIAVTTPPPPHRHISTIRIPALQPERNAFSRVVRRAVIPMAVSKTRMNAKQIL